MDTNRLRGQGIRNPKLTVRYCRSGFIPIFVTHSTRGRIVQQATLIPVQLAGSTAIQVFTGILRNRIIQAISPFVKRTSSNTQTRKASSWPPFQTNS